MSMPTVLRRPSRTAQLGGYVWKSDAGREGKGTSEDNTVAWERMVNIVDDEGARVCFGEEGEEVDLLEI